MNILINEHYQHEPSIAFILNLNSLKEEQPEIATKIEQALIDKSIITNRSIGYQNENVRNHIPEFPCTVHGEIEIWNE
jgi:hypothetical protein